MQHTAATIVRDLVLLPKAAIRRAGTIMQRLAGRDLDQMRETLEQRDRIMERHSHELRAPAQAIVGMVEILLTTPLDREQREYASSLRAAAQHILNLLEGLGGYAQIERGELALQLKPAALRRMLEAIVMMMSAGNGAGRSGIRLEWSADAPEWILGDEVLLRRTWTSLIDGAIVHSRNGLVVAVGASHPALPGTSTSIQVDISSPHAQPAPWGLGFEIASNLLAIAGGGIEDRSSRETGLRWRVELPATATQPDGKSAAPQPPAFLHRVLLAEDNHVNQLLAAKLLQRNQCEVVLAATGREAVRAMAESGPFDLVLMDLQMPEMDGLEATRQIRHAEGQSRRTPIVAMTACAMEGDRDRCMGAGMDDFLPKPLRWPDLQAMLTRWLPDRSASPRVRAAGA